MNFQEQLVITKALQIIESVKPIIAREYGIIPKQPSSVTLNNRLTRVLGRAYGKSFRIELSAKVFVGYEETKAFRSTVIHEYMHLIEYQLRGLMSHSPFWKSLMILCGAEPERCFNNEKAEEVAYHRLQKPVKLFTHSCDCRTFQLKIRTHNRILRGDKFTCRACGGVLT